MKAARAASYWALVISRALVGVPRVSGAGLRAVLDVLLVAPVAGAPNFGPPAAIAAMSASISARR